MDEVIKRAFDLIIASFALLLLSPLLGLVAILIAFSMGGPILFCQQRPGRHGKPFEMFKFRTMLNVTDAEGTPLPDDKRLTRVGKILRSTSLDELPELVNVVRGEMSLVGPRPLLMQYLDRYTCEQARRHELRPGITGWAQIHGRNAISWEEKFRLDVWYVDNHTFWLDMRILFATVWKVLRREDVSAESHATMPEFQGSERRGVGQAEEPIADR